MDDRCSLCGCRLHRTPGTYARGLDEDEKQEGREKLAGRIRLFHEVIEAGLMALDSEPRSPDTDAAARRSPGSDTWDRALGRSAQRKE